MTAYYNENQPYAAAWLRSLIAARLIPDGRVDERSIADVLPEDLAAYTQVHLFAGLGGWPLALRLAGWPDDRPILTGSCPCQPFSVAGKGGGVNDPRHLWPHMFRIVSTLRPPVIMGEQVSGTAGYGWLDGVHADLASENYTGEAVDIPAGSVNAPHIRNRLYWLAHPTQQRGGVLGEPRGLRVPESMGVEEARRGLRLSDAATEALQRLHAPPDLGLASWRDRRPHQPESLGQSAGEPAQRDAIGEQPQSDGRLGGEAPEGEDPLDGLDHSEQAVSLAGELRDGGGGDVGAGDLYPEDRPDQAGCVAHPDRGRCEQPDARDRSVSIPDAHESDVRLDDAPGPRRLPAGRDQVETLRDGAWSGEPERRGRDGGLGWLGDAQPPQRGPHAEGRSDVHDRADAGWPQAPSGPQLAGQLPGGLANPEDGGRRELRQPPGEDGLPDRSHARPGFWDEWTLVGPDPKGKYRRVGLIGDVRGVVNECAGGGDGLRPIDLLSKGQVQRVNKLRCLGNGLVIELAAEVIRAYMETHP